MITDIIRVSDYILDHDPMHPKMEYDYRFKIWKCPKRHSMLFIKPRITEYYEFDYIRNDYMLVTTESCAQYYRPSDFYDHYYSPTEINNMSDRNINMYIKYFSDHKCLFETKIYKKFLKMKKRDIIRCIQSLMTEKSYRIINDIHENPNYAKRNVQFDETWNTIFYYHLLPPRLKTCFVNIKEFTCTCKYNCNHVKHLLLRMIVFRYLYNNIDIYNFIKDLL